MSELTVEHDGVLLDGDDSGEGPAIVLLHGLTATRRYVVMGSKALERDGYRTIAYDARGHGMSHPASSPERYEYDMLADDLGAVLDAAGVERAVLAGASMGAHTLLRYALDHPERVAGIVVVTPAYDPVTHQDADRLANWDQLSDALRSGGVEAFVAANDHPRMPEGWRETVRKVTRQRLSLHHYPEAVADALRVVPRSQPFDTLHDLAALEGIPAVVVADRDDADPGHPLAIGEAYAAAIPGARLVVEEEGRSPIAWQGGQLSKVIAELASRAFP